MSKRRFSPKKRLKRDSNGRALCRYCESVVKPPRRTFCSAECVHEYKLRRSSSYVRRFLFKRDKGICSLCGIDTHNLKKQARKILTTDGKLAYKEFAKSLGMPPERKTWYDADHIVPVSLNGGECGLEGYRTLCVPCHKECTKELQKYLKESRKPVRIKHDGKRDYKKRKRNSG